MVDKHEKILWVFNDKSLKTNVVLRITNLGIIYEIEPKCVVLSPRWSDIKSITYMNSDYLLVVWDSHDGTRWKYRINVKNNARSVLEKITQINLDWSRTMDQKKGFMKNITRKRLNY